MKRDATLSLVRSALVRSALVRSALVRGLVLAFLWWVLSEGAAASWGVGAAVVVLATAASLALAPKPLPWPRIAPLLRFLPFFVVKSSLGGIDIVRRAFQPVPPLAPTLITCSVAGMGIAERVAFAVILALFPGTLSARLDGDALTLHVLDEALPVMEDFAALEARLAPIFGRAVSPAAASRERARR